MAGNKKDTTTTISQIPWLEANYKHVNDKVSRIRFIAILQTGDLHGYFNDAELGDETKFRAGLKVKDSQYIEIKYDKEGNIQLPKMKNVHQFYLSIMKKVFSTFPQKGKG
eukprot:185151_1